MITEKDLQEAIAECLGERRPTANTCIKLAAYYTIKDTLYPDEEKLAETGSYSFSSGPVENTVDYQSDTDFGRAIEGRNPDELWPLIDELVSSVQLVNPRLYDSFMRKL